MNPGRWLYGNPGEGLNRNGKNPLIGRPVGFHSAKVTWVHAPEEGSPFHGFEAVVIDTWPGEPSIYWIVAEVTKIPEDGPLPKHAREMISLGEIIIVPIGGDTAMRTLESERLARSQRAACRRSCRRRRIPTRARHAGRSARATIAVQRQAIRALTKSRDRRRDQPRSRGRRRRPAARRVRRVPMPAPRD